MTDENIEQIANTVYELAQKEINDNTNLKRLEKRLKDNETQNKNLIDSLKMCNVDSVRQTIFDEIQKMDEERKEIEKKLLLEGMQKIDITVPQIKFFLKEMRSGKIDDINYCKMLVNVLISKIYLYDDNITIIFNTQNKPYKEKTPLIEELEEKLAASSYKTRPAQPSPAQPYIFLLNLLVFRENGGMKKFSNNLIGNWLKAVVKKSNHSFL